MIRQSLEKGTMVWHIDYGFGIFVKRKSNDNKKALVCFNLDGYNTLVQCN